MGRLGGVGAYGKSHPPPVYFQDFGAVPGDEQLMLRAMQMGLEGRSQGVIRPDDE
ncbi:hypothetical protein LRQ04_18785 [Paenarthrobacter sp. AR 02]|uniref:hypothetical protein n=1 Tax=Paenarthrobacter sp. AR 02 TaxID=2899821 RepID=UPI001F4613C3|nr:hypothetical protein [Paenarthrobacter sp. AR 02]MCF3141303.1 hypothetical protein [Paenarthrobacter sp. AR 02]